MILLTSLQENTTFETLILVGCDIQGQEGRDILRELLQRNRTITRLDIFQNANFGDEGFAVSGTTQTDL